MTRTLTELVTEVTAGTHFEPLFAEGAFERVPPNGDIEIRVKAKHFDYFGAMLVKPNQSASGIERELEKLLRQMSEAILGGQAVQAQQPPSPHLYQVHATELRLDGTRWRQHLQLCPLEDEPPLRSVGDHVAVGGV